MQAVALPERDGIARARFGETDCFRARDAVLMAFDFEPVGTAAVKMFVERSGVIEFVTRKLPKRGRYLPDAHLPAMITFITDPKVVGEAQARVFSAIHSNRVKKEKAMQTIEVARIGQTKWGNPVCEMSAPDLKKPLPYTVTDKGCYVGIMSLAAEVSTVYRASQIDFFCRSLDETDLVRMSIIGGGKRGAPHLSMLHERRVSDFLIYLNTRKDYDKPQAGRFARRFNELLSQITPEIALSGLEGVVAPEPAAKEIVAQAMGQPVDLPAPVMSPAEPAARGATATRVIERLTAIEQGQAELLAKVESLIGSTDTKDDALRLDIQKMEKTIADAVRDYLKQGQFRLEQIISSQGAHIGMLREALAKRDAQVQALIEREERSNAEREEDRQRIEARDRQLAKLQAITGQACEALAGVVVTRLKKVA